jgi:3-deoxy-D-manno-octulosonic-acid transferase
MGLRERFGFYDPTVTKTLARARPVWIHGASVGEVLAAVRLVEEIRTRFPARKILLSALTQTGYKTAHRVAGDGTVIFFPLDHPWVIKRALSIIDPSLIIFLETEIWPNVLRLARRRGIPTLLLSGRLSERSVRRYSFFSSFFRKVLGNFSALGMQGEEDANRAKRLGADPAKVTVTGNLKIEASIEASALGLASSADSTHETANPPVLVAGSSHRGEEEVLLEAFRCLKQRFPDFRLVLAPRHPQRFPEVEKLLGSSGLRFEKMTQRNGARSLREDIFLLDTLGDLQKFYAIGDIAFVGGSLVDAGGHNLLEPARAGKPILFGPHMGNFAELADEMKQKGGGIEVQGVADLVRAVTDLLNDSDQRLAMGKIAHQIATQDSRVGERTFALLSSYLQPS